MFYIPILYKLLIFLKVGNFYIRIGPYTASIMDIEQYAVRCILRNLHFGPHAMNVVGICRHSWVLGVPSDSEWPRKSGRVWVRSEPTPAPGRPEQHLDRLLSALEQTLHSHSRPQSTGEFSPFDPRGSVELCCGVTVSVGSCTEPLSSYRT